MRYFWNDIVDRMSKRRKGLYRMALTEGTPELKRRYKELDKEVKEMARKMKVIQTETVKSILCLQTLTNQNKTEQSIRS